MWKPTNKTFTVLHMMNTSSITTGELQKFTGWMDEKEIGVRETIRVDKSFLDYAKKSDCFLSWLDVEKLIYWEEPEEVYKPGDRFYFLRDVYILVASKVVKDNYSLVSLRDGSFTDYRRIDKLTLPALNEAFEYLGEVSVIEEYEPNNDASYPQYAALLKLFNFCWEVGSWQNKESLINWICSRTRHIEG